MDKIYNNVVENLFEELKARADLNGHSLELESLEEGYLILAQEKEQGYGPYSIISIRGQKVKGGWWGCKMKIDLAKPDAIDEMVEAVSHCLNHVCSECDHG